MIDISAAEAAYFQVADRLQDALSRASEMSGTLLQIADTVEKNRQQGVHTDDDWLIRTAREAVYGKQDPLAGFPDIL